MDDAALVSGIAAFVGVALYLYVGLRLSKRQVPPEMRLPARQFTIFWLGLGVVTAIGGAESLVAALQVPPLALVEALLYLNLLLVCVVLWGLVGYLLFLFTGRKFALPLSILYAALGVLLVYFIAASGPNSVTVVQGMVALGYASQIQGPILGILIVLLIGPEFLGAILYFTLFFRTRDPTVRYRVTLVSWSLIAWFGLGLLNVGSLLGGGLAAQVVSHSLGIFAAIVILLAYYPPQYIRSRFRVSGIDEAPKPATA
jgi:hypothetical protein